MRILFLTNLHPTPWQPGRGTFNEQLVAGLRAAGHVVHVVVPVDWRERRGAPPSEVGGASFLTWVHPPRVRRDLWHRWMWWSIGHRLMREARAFAPDVVLGAWLHPDGATAVRLARALDRPVAVLAGGSDLLLLPGVPRRRREVVRVLEAADAVLTHGAHLREAAIHLHADPARTFAFLRGVDKERFRPGPRGEARRRLGLPDAARVLLSVGNLVPVKGHDVLVEALADPAMRELDWRWYHIGDGPEAARLRRRVTTLAIADRVTFVGRIRHDALAEWYRAADLQVLPSRSEGVPNVLLEGMACGLPFVASAVGGVAEVAESADWCVVPEDAGALARAIAAALASPPAVRRAVPAREDGVAAVLAALASTLGRAA